MKILGIIHTDRELEDGEVPPAGATGLLRHANAHGWAGSIRISRVKVADLRRKQTDEYGLSALATFDDITMEVVGVRLRWSDNPVEPRAFIDWHRLVLDGEKWEVQRGMLRGYGTFEQLSLTQLRQVITTEPAGQFPGGVS